MGEKGRKSKCALCFFAVEKASLKGEKKLEGGNTRTMQKARIEVKEKKKKALSSFNFLTKKAILIPHLGTHKRTDWREKKKRREGN